MVSARWWGRISAWMTGAVFLLSASAGDSGAAPATLQEFCGLTFNMEKKCPEDVCQIVCVPGQEGADCVTECRALECPQITGEACPKDYCEVMENCSLQKICHHKMAGERPRCGNLAYGGQDVPCCPGLIRRCGVEFLDGTCDMEGLNSVYSLPICIPCGDGICGQFEDFCNCPEDCEKKGIGPPQ